MSKPASTPRLTVSLSPNLEARTRRLVATGDYQSASEVVREALRLYFRTRDEHDRKLDALRSDLLPALEQLDRGEGTAFTAEEFLRWAEARFEEEHGHAAGQG